MAKGDGGIVSALKNQATAVLIMMGLAIVAVLAMVVLAEFQEAIPNGGTALINTTIGLFIAAFALFGTFSTLTALVIVVKGIIGVVKGLQ